MDDNGNKKQPMFKRDARTSVCMQLMKETKPGEVLTYKTIEAELGWKWENLRGYAASAKDILERDESIVFEVIRKVGFKRLERPQEILDTLPKYKSRVRRICIKGLVRTDCVREHFDELNTQQRSNLVAQQMIFRFTQDIAKNSGLKRLEAVIQKENKCLPDSVIPVPNMLEALGIKIDKT